jgi:fluoroquinolone transport system ATP-binding protein
MRDQGATVFLTTHDMVTADELCDRVAFLVDGRIAAIDSPRSLRLAHGRRTVRVETAPETGGRRAMHDYPLQGIGENADFLRVLRSETVETIHTQETTLEQVFVRLTGRDLGGSAAP